MLAFVKFAAQITSFEVRMLDMENIKEQFTRLFHVRLLEEAVLLAGYSVSLVSAVDTRAGDI
jgi:hypothetical protein